MKTATTITPLQRALLRRAASAPDGHVIVIGADILSARSLARKGYGEFRDCMVTTSFLVNERGRGVR